MWSMPSKNWSMSTGFWVVREPPCVLWIDEIEKAFGRGDNDGGTSQRIFGTFLSWLQEKKESVFVIATANDISSLPPELLRKGRFDEIFFVDLPGEETRRAIFQVHLKRRNRDPASFDLDALATATDGFSGAEIEQVVVSALYSAFGASSDIDTLTCTDPDALAAGSDDLLFYQLVGVCDDGTMVGVEGDH